MHHQSGRYFNYLNFLARHGELYANVMISDLRDVFFQSDPFAAPLPADIVFAQERCLIGASPVNSRWIEVAFGGRSRTTCATVRCPVRARPSARWPACCAIWSR